MNTANIETTNERASSSNKTNGVFRGKKIFVISPDRNVIQAVEQSVVSHGAVFFHSSIPKEAIGNVMSKNPDLVVFDDLMPPFNGAGVLSAIKRARPKGRILFLSQTSVPLRSIDTTAQGVSFSITRDASPEQIYNAVKHCLGGGSIPRVETARLSSN